MNWKQLHTASIPHERIEILIAMLRTIERRQRRLLLVHGRILRDRRQAQRWHYIHDRRDRRRPTLHAILFAFILATLSITIWLVSLNIHPSYAAPLLFTYNILLAAILLIKPNRYKTVYE